MAASDKNIIISPQRGSTTAQPSIVFTGDGNDPITLRVLDSAIGTLSFEGSAGQLFGISDSLTSGSIFSANYASGIPAIDVNANGAVSLAPTIGRVGIGTTNPVASLDLRSSSTEAMNIRRSDNPNAYGLLGISGSNIFRLGSYVAGSGWGDISFNDQIRFTSTGNVGIATANPSYKLHVVGDINFTGSLYQNGTIFTSGSGSELWTAGTGDNIYRLLGNVGIGITNPDTKLDVNGTIRGERYVGRSTLVLNSYQTVNPSSNVFLYSQPNDRDSWIYLDSADTGSNWGIYHRQIDSVVSGLPGNSIGFVGGGNNTLKAYISLHTGNAYFAGDTGIGVTNPSSRLAVNGFITESTNSGTTYWNVVTQQDVGTSPNQIPLNQYLGQLAFMDDFSPNGLRREGGSTDDVFVNTSGNVGIGTAQPGEPVSVYRNVDTGSQVRNHNASAGSSAFAAYRLSSDAASSAWWWLNSSARTVDGGANASTIRNDAGDMRLQAAGEVGLHIKASTGNIGIGVANPSAKLTVDGSINQTWSNFRLGIFYDNNFRQGLAYSTSERTLKIFSTTSDSGGNIAFYTRNGLGASDTDYGTQRMVISAAGNVGIGTANPTRKLHVEGTSTFSSNLRVGTIIEQVPYNSLNGGTLSWEGSAGQLFSITNNLTTGSIFSVNDVSGIPSIDVDANGTIELAPFAGNVGVGTTNPTTKLQVSGILGFFEQYSNANGCAGIIRIGNCNTGGVLGEVLYSCGEESFTQFPHSNVFIGDNAGQRPGFLNAGSCQNVFIGHNAGRDNGSYDNVFLGNCVAVYSDNASENVVIGSEAGFCMSEAGSNVYIGGRSGYLDSGYNNVFVGRSSGNGGFGNVTSTYENSFFGDVAGYQSEGSCQNVFMGTCAGFTSSDSISNVFVGYGSGRFSCSACENVYIGQRAGFCSLYGNNNIAIGTNAGATIGDYGATLTPSGLLSLNYASGKIVIGNSFTTNFHTKMADYGSGGAAVYWNSSSYELYSASSSARYKENIRPFLGGLQEVLQMEPVTFTYIEQPDAPEQVGLIAEQLDETQLTHFVNYNKESLPESVLYDRIVVLAINAIKELNAQNQTLQERIKTLEEFTGFCANN